MKRMAYLGVVLLVAMSAAAATGKQVTYQSGDESVSGMLYTPADAKGKLPAIVVIHEWWGLNDWVKEQAQKLAAEGYVTLAVDLYRGQTASSRDEAHELSRGLPDDRALRDLRAAVAYLKTLPNVNGERIGAIGWCMGGGKAAALAANEPSLQAVVINYGSVPSDPETLKNWNAAVLGIFGAKDRGIPVESAKKFEAALKQQGKDVEMVVYDEAGHAFQNPNNQAGYRAADAQDAWQRIVGFFNNKLKT